MKPELATAPAWMKTVILRRDRIHAWEKFPFLEACWANSKDADIVSAKSPSGIDVRFVPHPELFTRIETPNDEPHAIETHFNAIMAAILKQVPNPTPDLKIITWPHYKLFVSLRNDRKDAFYVSDFRVEEKLP